MCPAPAQHLLSLQQRGEGQDNLQGRCPPAELQTLSRGPLSRGTAFGHCQPPAPLQRLQLGQRGVQGQAPWDSIPRATGRGLVQEAVPSQRAGPC